MAGHPARMRSLVGRMRCTVEKEWVVMKLASILAAGMLLLLSASGAVAQTDCKKLVPPSPWGPNDQTGATNRVTPAVTKAAAAEIQEGKVIPLSYPLVDGVPLFGTRFTKTILTATSLAPGAAFGENELTYMEDTWLSQSHVGTHLDGIGKDAAEWLAAQKVVAVGADQWAVEVIPGEDPKEAFIVHNILLTDHGIHTIENVRTDLMAAEAARTNRATFFFNMTVPRAVGMTGNFVGIDGIR